jgi:hypothetical protein
MHNEHKCAVHVLMLHSFLLVQESCIYQHIRLLRFTRSTAPLLCSHSAGNCQQEATESDCDALGNTLLCVLNQMTVCYEAAHCNEDAGAIWVPFPRLFRLSAGDA